MRRPRFFTDQPLVPGTRCTLEAEPSRHIARALRMGEGDRLYLFSGDGREAAAIIAGVDRNQVAVEVESIDDIHRESPLQITLAIALSRGDRVDTIIQKATELGVTRIWPLISERTGVRLDAARLEKKQAHWRRIAISACEQCGRNQIPELQAPESLDRILARAGELPDDHRRYLLHPAATPAALPERCAGLLLLVGPEGGFSDSEARRAADAGFEALQIGPRVLRAETAPLAAIAIAQARYGDLLAGGH